jgi:hypothetical protein
VSGEDIVDPRVVPRWVEAGVSGVPRGREWDVVVVVDVPELEPSLESEIAFRVSADGRLEGAERLPPAVVERIADEIGASVRPPYEVLAARRGPSEWSVAARERRGVGIELPGVEASEVTVAVTPDGVRTGLVDGTEIEASTGALDAALDELERRGRERFRSFVARAERGPEGRWELTVDPL